MDNPSPRPWKPIVVNRGTYGIDAADDTSIIIYGNVGEEAGVHGDTPEQGHANAALIVKAVNLHDELVAALNSIMHQVEGSRHFSGVTAKRVLDCIGETARTVLAAVE